eukprot:m.99126 g.99126  ORF g.99126 m.99126 type:complete len:473 (-) comp13666_c0_seq3:83-1501(-)
MNEKCFELTERVIGKAYTRQAHDARRRQEQLIKILLEHRKWPQVGWDEQTIELFLNELSLMDSNNFLGNVGVGEREARIVSRLVSRMRYHFGHGVGRSGDIAALQPKAAGSSLMARLTECMVLDLIKTTGVTRAKACIILPVATGMTLLLTLLSLRVKRTKAKYVLWPRVDQKSCFKAICSAGLTPVIIPNKLVGDEIQTNMDELSKICKQYHPDEILCILSTVSCFAPRAPDDIVGISSLCKELGIPHVSNNAYGLQSSKYTHLLNESIRIGRLDVFIQSTDKNLLVPVGGAIAAGPNKEVIESIGKTYPGRASATPAMDVFVTLLHIGVEGYQKLLRERKENFLYLKERFGKLALDNNERLLETKNNTISLGMSLGNIKKIGDKHGKDIKFLGSMLFSRCVSGTRVVLTNEKKTIADHKFQGYGAHLDEYTCPYLTAAAAIGMDKDEVDVFVDRLQKAISEFIKPPKEVS